MKLRDIAIALPSRRVDSATIARWVGMEPDFITDKIGIASRCFLGEEETLLTLATEAGEKLLRRNPDLNKADIKLLLLVTQNPDHKLPHSSALLQEALSLGNDSACFDVNLGCSGYVYALGIAKGLMAAEGITEGLVVTCDPYSRIMGRTDRDTISLFGDAATATWLSASSGGDLGRLDFGTDGSGAQHLMVKAGGSSRPISWIGSEDGIPYGPEDFRLKMAGRAIFNFMMARVPQSVANCLAKNNLSLADIDFFVFHQASRFLLDSLRQRMKLPEDKVPCNIKEVGNTVSSSIPLLLAKLQEEGVLRGKTVLISGFGVGLSWATNIIHF